MTIAASKQLNELTDRLRQAQEIIETQLAPLLKLTPAQADDLVAEVLDLTGSPRLAQQALGRAFSLLAPAANHAQVVSRCIEEGADASRALRRRVADLIPTRV